MDPNENQNFENPNPNYPVGQQYPNNGPSVTSDTQGHSQPLNMPQQTPPPEENTGSHPTTGFPQTPSQESPQTPYTPPPQPASNSKSSSGVIVLQWLTYAFWGWTVLSLAILTVSTMASYVADSDTSTFTVYALAAVLVLLPISFVCDHFYSKHEPAKKAGASMVVMVIHAVLFALFCIGSLITAVFSAVQLAISSSDTTNTKVALYSALIITVIYAALFLRTLNPSRLAWIRKFFAISMVAVVAAISILGIAGPIVGERARRVDRLIENNMSTVQGGINNYADQNNKLPDSLDTLDVSGDAKKLIESNAIKYTPNSKPATSNNDSYSSQLSLSTKTTYTYYYTLCVNYEKSTKNSSGYSGSRYGAGSDDYSAYISAYDHDSGNVCYKGKTSAY
ncbi:hypothetical protein HY857_00935 [Candidatus Saccharibacteria bacterium]|nr:hypothetical protein [Candidatus Saccharibacteria bacterium]